MPKQRWQRVEAIFQAAIKLPASEVAAYLDDACGDDADLRQTLERLLDSDVQAGAFLEDALLGGIELVEAITDGGQMLGQYRLIERIGSGGMGAVYRAARADSEYDQVVAIKVIHAGMGSPLTVERFRRERQILAGLQHPNIARLLDGGTTDNGLPYLVMEYIEGEPIDQYCDRLKLSVTDRLGLFVTVCAAVNYAHQNLVVHRDLKPSNVLVTTAGTVKLLDFGIAKLLTSEEQVASTEPTLTLERALTPSYASPEQIRGDLVSTSSDVYSLGVVLFELLVGRRPFDLSGVTRREAERRVLEDPPPAPSSALTFEATDSAGQDQHAKQPPEVVARRRGTRPEVLRRQLQGDLDTIILTALRKDRANRYPSVDNLAQDARRHLEGLPIKARPPTFSYRATKFLGRNRVAVAVAVAFVLLLGAFSLILGHRSKLARQEQERTQQVGDLLFNIIQSANPSLKGGAQITFREQLDYAANQIERQFRDQPHLQADLQEKLVDSYLNLGLAEEARVLIEKAIATRRAVVDENDPRLSKSHNRLGATYQQLGDYERAEALHRRALALHQRDKTQDPSRIADINNDLANALERLNRWDEAEAYYRQALALYREGSGDQREWVAIVLGNLGSLLSRQNRPREAEATLREALEIDRGLFGEPSTRVADDLNYLGFTYLNDLQYQSAVEYHGRALTMRRALLEPDHPAVVESINNLATALSALGRFEEAEPLYREGAQLWVETRDPHNPSYTRMLNNLGIALQKQGRFQEATGPLMEALRLRRALNPRGVEVVESLINNATLFYETGDWSQAADFYAQAAEIEAAERPGGGNRAVALAGLGATYRVQREFEAAIPPLRQARSLIEQLVGPEDPAIAYFSIALARALGPTRHNEEAEALLRQAVEIRRASQPDHPLYAKALVMLAEHLVRVDRAAEAETLTREALRNLEHGAVADDTLADVANGVLATSLAKQGQLREANRLMDQSIDHLTRRLGPEHPDTREARARAEEMRQAVGPPRDDGSAEPD